MGCVARKRGILKGDASGDVGDASADVGLHISWSSTASYHGTFWGKEVFALKETLFPWKETKEEMDDSSI